MKGHEWLWLALLLLLGGCESQPAGPRSIHEIMAVADTAALRPDPATRPRPQVWWVPRPAGAFRLVDTTYGQREWRRIQPTPPRITTGYPTGYYRYRGTLGGQALTLEITTSRTSDSLSSQYVSGCYYLDWGGKAHDLWLPGEQAAGGVWQLREKAADDTITTADWYATQPFGPVLAGQRRNRRTGQVTPFYLREDYTNAVRYEIISEEIHGDTL